MRSLKDVNNQISKLEKIIKNTEAVLVYTKVQKAVRKDEFIIPTDRKRFDTLEKNIVSVRQQKKEYENLLSTRGPSLGHVYAASGYQERCLKTASTHTPSILDWALIRVNKERIGENTVRKPSPFYTSYVC